jgi:2-amino-4-hydroxy-6-hydroxymethyldihydropteridine diphosphokinase
MKHLVYILLGSNLGDRLGYLQRAREEMNKMAGEISDVSHVYETEPIDMESELSFLNQAVKLETDLSPLDLLKSLHGIEKKFGRLRLEKLAPRTIDLDIGLYDNQEFTSEHLTIPHPRLHVRNFVLAPLSEIAGNVLHPLLGHTISELYKLSSDQGEVSILAGS